MENSFNSTKIIHAILFILDKMGGTCDFHKISKMFYFADQKHLLAYGMLITGDEYIAMKYGPVPSKTYDILKSLRSDIDQYKHLFELESRDTVFAKGKPNMRYLAQSDVECLSAAIEENKNLTFEELTNKSHKEAWQKAQGDASIMNILDIAKEANADEQMLAYINETLENQNLF